VGDVAAQAREAAGAEVGVPMVPVFKPLIGAAEIRAATEALEMGWLGMGAFVGEFEDALHRIIEASDRHVVAVSTGHAALHLGLILAGVGAGDEVITPAFNNVADFQAILATGAMPVFCDVDDATLCIDLEKAEELVSKRTRAVIATDYGCLLCAHDGLRQFAERHDLRVVHDAAHSLGSRYKGRMVGSFSDICMFSFDPVKAVTCIDGGALVVRTEDDLKQLQEMRLIGMGQSPAVMYQNKRAWGYDVRRMGFRYHLANLHAAIGLAQLEALSEISGSRRETCRFYSERLGAIPGVRVPGSDFTDITPFSYYIRVGEEQRQELRAFLAHRGVDTGIHWQPGHWFTLFEKCRRGDLSVTDRVGKEIMTLPLHSMMDDEDRQRVVTSVAQFFEKRA
jgi:dTDP-4-amino-4,6-dideoxygalactose transaminase